MLLESKLFRRFNNIPDYESYVYVAKRVKSLLHEQLNYEPLPFYGQDIHKLYEAIGLYSESYEFNNMTGFYCVCTDIMNTSHYRDCNRAEERIVLLYKMSEFIINRFNCSTTSDLRSQLVNMCINSNVSRLLFNMCKFKRVEFIQYGSDKNIVEQMISLVTNAFRSRNSPDCLDIPIMLDIKLEHILHSLNKIAGSVIFVLSIIQSIVI